jgi:hypothetical protein
MPYESLLRRMRAEYLEMPGLRLTLAQAQRMFDVDAAICRTLLDTLVEAGFICVRADGSYARLSDRQFNRPQPLEAAPTTRVTPSR